MPDFGRCMRLAAIALQPANADCLQQLFVAKEHEGD